MALKPFSASSFQVRAKAANGEERWVTIGDEVDTHIFFHGGPWDGRSVPRIELESMTSDPRHFRVPGISDMIVEKEPSAADSLGVFTYEILYDLGIAILL